MGCKAEEYKQQIGTSQLRWYTKGNAKSLGASVGKSQP